MTTTTRLTGRGRIAFGIALVVVVVAAVLVPRIVRRHSTHGSLRLASESYDICYRPPTSADWQSQVRYGLAYGLDVLTLSSAAARVTVTAVQMIDPTPGFELLSVALIPSSGVGLGARGDHDWPVSDPRLLPLVRPLPAQLRAMPETAAMLKLPAETGREWTLAVKVRVPANTVKGRVDGFRVTYRTGSRTKTLRTKDTVTIGTGGDICAS